MDFIRCVEDIVKRCVENIKLRRVRANHSEAFEALQILDTRLTSYRSVATDVL